MSTEPTKVNTNKTNTAAPEPKTKDKFLARLVETFGNEKGVTIYQQYDVTEQELIDLIALATKFDMIGKIIVRR